MQEVFLSVSINIAQFSRKDSHSTFRGWLWTIARNKSRDLFRRGEKHPAGIGGTDAKDCLHRIPDVDFKESEEASSADSTQDLAQRAVELIRSDFDEKTWQCFHRMTVNEETSAEIGRDLGMSKDAVRRAKYRVLRRLREELDGLL